MLSEDELQTALHLFSVFIITYQYKKSRFQNESIVDGVLQGLEKNEDKTMSKDNENTILNELRDLRKENEIANSRIDNANKITAIVGTVIGLVLTVFIFASNAQYNAIKDINNANMNKVETKIEAINQKLDSIQQNNSMQIQRDVAQEMLKYKK